MKNSFGDLMKSIALISLVLLASCTNQAVYESIQSDARLECNRESTPSAQEKCREKLLPYKEYERKRNEP
jgi:hypothetical protein